MKNCSFLEPVFSKIKTVDFLNLKPTKNLGKGLSFLKNDIYESITVQITGCRTDYFVTITVR